MPKLLFVCTANQFRSPLAAAYFSRKLKEVGFSENWDVISAGTWTRNGLPAHPSAIMLSEEYHLDLGSHKTQEINVEYLSEADLVIVMEQGHKEALCLEFPLYCEKIMLLGQATDREVDDITDPAANNFEDARLIANMIIDTINTKFPEITALIINRVKANQSAREK